MPANHRPAFLPAASYHLLTPAYDLLSSLVGLGRRFKSTTIDLAGIVDGTRVLDLACGTGLTSLLIKGRYPNCMVTGLDVDARILQIARRHMTKRGLGGINLVCARAESTGLEDASFDTVISALAFHHLPPRSKQDAAREVSRLLRAGGTFFLVDLQPRSGAVPAGRNEEANLPRWAYRANTSDELREVFARAGLHAHATDPPRTWAFRPWLFALRATKPADVPPRPRAARPPEGPSPPWPRRTSPLPPP